MTSEDSRTQIPAGDRRICYRQGGREVCVEPLDNIVAVRYREGAELIVHEALRSQAEVRAIKSQRLLIAEFPDAMACTEALRQLQPWVDEGVVEFITPVLRDEESQSRQIVTDEITLRFESVLCPGELEQVEQKYGVVIARQNEFVPKQFVVKVAQPEGLRTLDVASQLDAGDGVDFAAPNLISEYKR